MKNKVIKQIKSILKITGKPLATIGIALFIGIFLIAGSGVSPIEAYIALFEGAFGSSNAILNTLAKSTPLIFTGLAAAIAATAGVFNIGIEGQLYIGALAAAVCGVNLGFLPAFILVPLCFLCAMLFATLWALLPGWLNSKLKINIFIMFFMLNNMAMLLTEYLANGPFQGDIPDAITDRVSTTARLFKFSNYADVNVGLIIALVLIIVSWFILKKTKFGYECQALGQNRTFSQYIGLKATKQTLVVLAISAMIAGLAGAEQVMGSLGRFYANFSDDLGFTGISIGLLASNNPIGVVLFALFFGALRSGGLYMSANVGISSDLVDVLQSIMIIMISGQFAFKIWKLSRKPKSIEAA